MDNNFNPDNAVAVNETSQGTIPTDTGNFNVDNAVPVTTKGGQTPWDSFRQAPKASTMPQDEQSTDAEGKKLLSADKAQKIEPGQQDKPLKGVSKAGKAYTEVIGPSMAPDEGWLNAGIYTAQGAAWNMVAKPLLGKEGYDKIGGQDVDRYLSDMEKQHPIAATIGGTAPYIASAALFPEELLPNVWTRTAIQFGFVSGMGAVGEDTINPQGNMEDRINRVAGETLKGMSYGPIFAGAQELKFINRPFATALARAGIIGVGTGTMSTFFGDNITQAFKQGGILGALSLITESPHLASTVLGRGIINHANSIYADMAVKAGLPPIQMDPQHPNFQSQVVDVAKGLAKQIPGNDKSHIVAATVKMEDGSQIHGASHQDALDKVGYNKPSEPETPSKWQSGAEPAASIPGEPLSFLDPPKDVDGYDFDKSKAQIIYEEDEKSNQPLGYKAVLANGRVLANPNADKIGGSPYFDTLQDAQEVAERNVEVDSFLDWEMSQEKGERRSYIDAEGNREFQGNASGHSDAMQMAADQHKSYAKVYDLLKKYRDGGKLTDIQRKTVDNVLADYRKNIKPLMESPVEPETIQQVRDRAMAKEHTHHIDTPERKALRQKIADKFYGNGSKNKDSRVDLVLGLPAAGKGKFLEEIAKKYGSLNIDNDLYKADLPEYDNGVGAYATHKESEMIEDLIMSRAVGSNDNMAIAWLGKNPDKIRRYIDLFKKLGYEVHVTNVELSVEKAMGRAITRFQETGRFVDPEYIKEIGLTTLKNNDSLEMDGRLASYEKYSTDVPKGTKPNLKRSILNKGGQRSGGLFGELKDSNSGKSSGQEKPKPEVIHPGFTVLNPDGSSKFITREESQKEPYNLDTGHSEDVPGLNESKFMKEPEVKITNPQTLDLIANNAGKMDINIVPGTAEAAELFSRSHAELKEKFAPYTVGKEGQYAAEVLREQLGEFARANDRMDAATKQARDVFNKATNESNLDFMDKFEAGKKQDNVALQKISDVLRDIDDKDWAALKATGKVSEENFIENHLPHYWDRADKMISMIKKIFARRPWEGAKSFKKHRVFTTMREGIDAGFTPSSYNPVDFIMWRHREVTKFIAAINTKEALKEQGLRVFVKTGQEKPQGWVKINDPAEEVYYSNEAKELVKSGVYYTQPDAARIVNGYLEPGVAGRSYIYDLYRGAGNTLNQFQLGISAFHLGFTSMDATISKFALGINKLSTGDFAGAIKEFGKAPFAPITNIMQGRELLQAWYGKDKGEITNTIADLMASGGGRARMDKFYATGMKDSLSKSIKEGKLATAAFKVPFYIVEQVARPIMEYIVPRQKMGVFMDMMKMEMERNPQMTHEQMRGVAQKAWDSVDNRMGQLVYDNLFWNRTTKDLAMASVRSLGWNLGTVREIGGGVKDVFGNVDDVIHGKATKMSYRTAYVMALPIVTGLYGAIYQYLHTGMLPGQGHEDEGIGGRLRDLFFPRNGAIDNKGQEARISLPTYMKDIYHYTTNPVQTVINKFSPVNNAVLEMMNNKDYYGVEIRNVDDPAMQQIADESAFMASQFLPFGFRNQGRDTRTSLGSKIEPFIGLVPAPYDVNMTKAEREANEFVKGNIPPGSRTKAQAQHSQDKYKLMSDYMSTKDRGPLDTAVDSGIISSKERKAILKDAAMTNLQRLTRSLTPEQVNHLIKVATPKEKEELEDILAKKRENKEKRGTWTTAEEEMYAKSVESQE